MMMGDYFSPQSLTVCQRSLTTMQIQIQGLLQFSVPLFPTAEVKCLSDILLQQTMERCVSFLPLLYLVIQRDLLGIQRLLNSTEFSLHQLTALLDCRGLHKVRSDSNQGSFFNKAAL